jgi:hypothetical protein
MSIVPFFAALRRCFDYSGTMSRADFGCFLGWLLLLTIGWRLITHSWMPVLLLALPPLVSAMVRRSRDARPEEVRVILVLLATPLVFAFLYAMMIALGERITGGTWPDLLFQIPVAIVAVALWGLILLSLLVREGAEKKVQEAQPDPDAERARAQALITEMSDQIARKLGFPNEPAAKPKLPPDGKEIAETFKLLKLLCAKYSHGMASPNFEKTAEMMRKTLMAGGWVEADADTTERAPERFQGTLEVLFPKKGPWEATPEGVTAFIHPHHPEALAVIEFKHAYPQTNQNFRFLLSPDLAEAAARMGVDSIFYRSYPDSFQVRQLDVGLAIGGSSLRAGRDGLSTFLTIRKLSQAALENAPGCAAGYVELGFDEQCF